MALSQQDLFVNLLLPNKKGYYVDIGAGNGEGIPCASNTIWLEELGWKGILLEFKKEYCEEAKVLRPNSHIVKADAYAVDYKKLFEHLNVPKTIDYLSIDIDPWYSQACNVDILSKFPHDEYEFKILTIEHDLYNTPVGKIQKPALMEFYKNSWLKEYYMVVENIALQYSGTKYIEDWFINPKYFDEFNIIDIGKLKYFEQNPNDMIMDLINRRKVK